jgi:uncharacterized cysteine cluster protein YcgN (CxxCxxCC family)
MSANFWEEKALSEMTNSQWESLCDGCGKCCLHKLEDEDDDKLYYTDIACELLDVESCRCGDYKNRVKKVPSCLTLTPATLKDVQFLPDTCAYRLLSEDKPLASWHPLISGNNASVHEAGISVSGRVLSETYIHPDDFETRVINWIK